MKKLIIIFFILLGFVTALVLPWVRNDIFHTVNLKETTTPKVNAQQAPISTPHKIIIPSLGVNAQIEPVRKDNLGRMDIPKSYNNAGWYSLGPKPGEMGNAVIDGHVDTPNGLPSIFADLDKLTAGDRIIIVDIKGKTLNFKVLKGVNYPLSKIPLEYIFNSSVKYKRLNLITCSGNWDKKARMYTDRYVVYSVME